MSPRPLLDPSRDGRARADVHRKNRPTTTERTARSPVVRLARARVDVRTTGTNDHGIDMVHPHRGAQCRVMTRELLTIRESRVERVGRAPTKARASARQVGWGPARAGSARRRRADETSREKNIQYEETTRLRDYRRLKKRRARNPSSPPRRRRGLSTPRAHSTIASPPRRRPGSALCVSPAPSSTRCALPPTRIRART